MHNRKIGLGCILMAAMLWAARALPTFSQTPAAADSTGAASSSKDEISALKQQLAEQQKMLEKMQAAMAALQKRLNQVAQGEASGGASVSADGRTAQASKAPEAPSVPARPASLGQVASLSPVVPAGSELSPAAASAVSPVTPAPFFNNGASPADEEGTSPLSVRIGNTEFTPGGFMDFTTVFRSTNVGSGIGTSFGGIPFSNTPQGRLTETRLSMQNSRVSLDVNSQYLGWDLHGHLEADFLGNAPANVFVGSNSNTLRSRLYWIDARKGKFEFLGGQSWSLIVPGRNGFSPNPSDIFYSQNMDTNYQLGLTWSRQAGFRMVYHPSATVAAAIAIEDPQQFVGGSTLPSTFPASEVETGGGNTATPNVAPDIIGKLAFDPKLGGLLEHIEFVGLLTSARVYDPNTQRTSSAKGGAGSVNFNLELVKNFHFVVNTYYSDGGGRYIFALGPGFVVRPGASGVLGPAMLHSGSGIAGFEYQVNKNSLLYAYYGGAYFGRYVSTDPATGNLIGYGYSGAPSSQNRALNEGTLGLIQTFWKNPHYGALQLITQYSYLTRAPWFVASGSPKDAHTNMGWVNLRYVLP